MDINHRYLWWLLHAQVGTLLSMAVGSTYDAVTAEDIGAIRAMIPSMPAQVAIADYLDAETARIDALIEKKRRMVDLIDLRQTATVERRIRDLAVAFGATPLKYAVRQVEVGIVVQPSQWYADEGVKAIRGFNVKPGAIWMHDLATITREGDELHSKSRLRSGDIVVVRTGQAGAAAVVPPELDGCNCIDVVIVRPSDRVIPKYLEFVLNSDWTQKHIEEHSVGTIQAHFNVGSMKEVPVPIPPLAEQRDAIQDLQAHAEALMTLMNRLMLQVRLLAEHRQALITAAVTGDLEVPDVAA
jgi:type I restriction enzyme S subunit